MAQLFTNEVVVLTSIFASIVLFALAIAGLIRRDPAERRFRGAAGGAGASVGESASIVHEDRRSPALKLIEPFQRAIAQSDPNQVSAAKQRLIEAGFYRPSAIEIYFTMRIVLGIGFAALAGLYIYFLNPQFSNNLALFVVVGAAAIGYYLPVMVVSSKLNGRRKEFKLGMPDALDMMLVGVEAGLSLPAAMQHIVDEFVDTHPIVSEQFQIVVLEFQAGKSRAEALRGMAGRMNLPETRTLATMIVQSETLGTSLAQTLRVMADELRNQRMLDAEKRASELPVMMSFPLVLCIFPALMAVALVPAMLQSLTFFSNL